MDDTELYVLTYGDGWVPIRRGSPAKVVANRFDVFGEVAFRTQDGETGWLVEQNAYFHELVGPGDWLETWDEKGLFDWHLIGYPGFLDVCREREEYQPYPYQTAPDRAERPA